MKLLLKIIILNLIILVLTDVGLNKEIKNVTQSSLDFPYCFRFTWLGPKANNESLEQNATCEDLELSKKDPCRLPLVVTDNTNIPNTTWLWKKFEKGKVEEIACRLVKGDVCAKVIFSYNQQVENITYMCTKVSIDGEGAAPYGCYVTDHGNGRQTEVCACESSAGRQPCNNANSEYNAINFWKFLIFTIIVCFNIKKINHVF